MKFSFFLIIVFLSFLSAQKVFACQGNCHNYEAESAKKEVFFQKSNEKIQFKQALSHQTSSKPKTSNQCEHCHSDGICLSWCFCGCGLIHSLLVDYSKTDILFHFTIPYLFDYQETKFIKTIHFIWHPPKF